MFQTNIGNCHSIIFRRWINRKYFWGGEMANCLFVFTGNLISFFWGNGGINIVIGNNFKLWFIFSRILHSIHSFLIARAWSPHKLKMFRRKSLFCLAATFPLSSKRRLTSSLNSPIFLFTLIEGDAVRCLLQSWQFSKSNWGFHSLSASGVLFQGILFFGIPKMLNSCLNRTTMPRRAGEYWWVEASFSRVLIPAASSRNVDERENGQQMVDEDMKMVKIIDAKTINNQRSFDDLDAIALWLFPQCDLTPSNDGYFPQFWNEREKERIMFPDAVILNQHHWCEQRGPI